MIALVAMTALAGCALPRGAGFQREVLSVATDDDVTTPEFQVEAVTRDGLSRFESWPSVGETRRGWINRQAQSPNQIIASGDKISVTVWNIEENSLLTVGGQRFVKLGDMTVASNGTIFAPYIGTVRISGMSPDHAREVIEEKYRVVIPSAEVQLDVVQGRQNTVSLVGGVANAGPYPLTDQDITVLDLLSMGGGISNSLDNPQVKLIRGSDIYSVSASRLFSNPALNTTLRGGDKVIVERDSRYFLSLGATSSESSHPFTKDSISALEALSIIGGVADNRANPKGVLILRQYPASAIRSDGSGPQHQRVVFTIDLTSADGLFSASNFRINSGDLVYATESPVNSARTIFGLIGSAFGLANQVTN